MKESGLTGSRLSGASITVAADMNGIVCHRPATDHEGNPWFGLRVTLASDRRPLCQILAGRAWDCICSMFLVTTSNVWPSSWVGPNSTTSVPAWRTGVCPGPT
jgi:hypothetical protein